MDEPRQLVGRRGEQGRGIAGDSDEHTAHRVRFERERAGDGVEEQHAERPDVGTRIDVVAADLLGREKRRGAEERRRALVTDRVERAGRAEIEDLEDARVDLGLDRLRRGQTASPARRRLRLREQDVLRFEIPVDESQRVRLREPLACLQDPARGFGHGESFARRELGLECRSLEPLRRDVGHRLAGQADLDDARDVLTSQAGREPRLVEASAKEVILPVRVRRKNLERDALTEVKRARREHDSRGARADKLLDAVPSCDRVTRAYVEPGNQPDASAALNTRTLPYL